MTRHARSAFWVIVMLGTCPGLASAQAPPVITTVAGVGRFSGDGGPATAAQLNYPIGIAIDGSGNRYIADSDNHAVRKVSAGSGIISTVAGTGTAGYSGDGGAATAARLNSPRGVAVDGSGNLYIADTGNHRIRKVDAGTGVISTVAGAGTAGYSGDGGAATAAELNYPYGVAVSGAGHLYIADTGNHAVRKVAGGSGGISTIAGTGSRGFSGDGGAATAARLDTPHGLAVDGGGNVHIADTLNNRVRLVTVGSGIITTAAGTGVAGFSGDGGAATLANLDFPGGVAVDGSGNVYIADQANHRLRAVAAAGGVITTAAGTGVAGFSGDGGAATLAQLNQPSGVALDTSGNLHIVELANHRVRMVTAASGIISTEAGSDRFGGDGGPATAALMNRPQGMAVDGAGNLYIVDRGNHRVRKVAAGTGTITTVAGSGAPGYNGDGISATAAQLYNPSGIATDTDGNLYVADSQNHRIRKVTAATGLISTVAGTGTAGYNGDGIAAAGAKLGYPQDVAVDAAGDLYIADTGNLRVRKVTAATGKISTLAGDGTYGYNGDGFAATQAWLASPQAVAVDGAGNVYVADSGNQRVRMVAASNSAISTIAGTGTAGYGGDGGAGTAAMVSSPQGLALDANGNVYIADTDNHRVRRIAAGAGIITTFAGTGTAGGSGDGGPATASQLTSPASVTVDSLGRVYIADTGNDRVRLVRASARARSDFNGDSKSDILWRHAAHGDVWLWPMDGATRTAETFVRTVGDTNWEIRGLGDQTGDGQADILWRNKVNGQIYFWPMNGSTPLGEIYVSTVSTAYDIVGTGDFDGDGKSDILWRHTGNGEVWIWLMNGPALLSQVYVDRVDPGYVVKGVGDLDKDLKADIVWHHGTTGEVWVWLMNGATRLSQTWIATVPDTGYRIRGVADFTGDGKADIVWHHDTRGEVWIWTMDGNVRLSETWVATVPNTNYGIVGVGDYNGDTKADILWWNSVNGQVWTWIMDGTTRISETWTATVPDTGYRIIR